MVRSLASCLFGLVVAALSCGPALAQPASGPQLTSATTADMAMPDDLGAPLAGAPVDIAPVERTLSVKTSIAVIASSPQGRTVLEHDLPGLCERPEFMMFKSMSPAKLAALSRGRISETDLNRLQNDLMKVSLTETPRPHSLFTRGGRTVGRFSKAVYQHVVLMIASL